MITDIRLSHTALAITPAPGDLETGAVATFEGVVRGTEAGRPIQALVYEAYEPMAENEMLRIARDLDARLPILRLTAVHRLGTVPVGETAIIVRVESRHRGEAFSFLAQFMDRLKMDVPIWKKDLP